MKMTKDEKRAYWAKHIEAWKASGETRSDYCRIHRLKPHQLSYWNQVYRSKLHGKQVSSPRGFVAVQVSNPRNRDLIVELPNGLRLEGVHADNLPVIREIIRWSS